MEVNFWVCLWVILKKILKVSLENECHYPIYSCLRRDGNEKKGYLWCLLLPAVNMVLFVTSWSQSNKISKSCSYTISVKRNSFFCYSSYEFICSRTGEKHTPLNRVECEMIISSVLKILSMESKINYLSIQLSEKWVIHYPFGALIHQNLCTRAKPWGLSPLISATPQCQ